jgi:hypothetical protein
MHFLRKKLDGIMYTNCRRRKIEPKSEQTSLAFFAALASIASLLLPIRESLNMQSINVEFSASIHHRR